MSARSRRRSATSSLLMVSFCLISKMSIGSPFVQVKPQHRHGLTVQVDELAAVPRVSPPGPSPVVAWLVRPADRGARTAQRLLCSEASLASVVAAIAPVIAAVIAPIVAAPNAPPDYRG